MFFSKACMAVLGFTSFTSAHMLLAKPPPYAGLQNGPLNATGGDFPCQLKFDGTAATTMPLGSTQALEFTGSAVHGGGSCQISITYDDPPTKDSVFKVIHSIEGGCPARNAAGNLEGPASLSDPDTYSFTMPTNLPTGKAVLAWTWFNKIGNREMYMNCAPIDITASSSKRDEAEDNLVRDITQLMGRDQSAYIALPNMFKANILNIGADGCGTNATVDLVFPNPGNSVDRPGLQANYGPPAGSCDEASPPTGSGSSGSSGSGSSSVVSDPPAASTSAPAQGGVFVTTAGASSVAAATTLVTSATAAPVPASSTAPAASPSESPAPSSGGSGESGSAGAMTAGSACSPEGLWNCVGGTSFQQCASGTWSVVQSLAAGTQCTPGQSANINIVASKAKRAVRFSSEHVRRHVQRSAET